METQSFSSDGITKWIVASIDEQPSFYKLALMADEPGGGAYNIKKVEYIWVWRQLMDNGFEYQTDCLSLTNRRFPIHCQYLKDPVHLLEWISSKLLTKLC